jgi:hypothetical protein
LKSREYKLLILTLIALILSLPSWAKPRGYLKFPVYYFTESYQGKERVDLEVNLELDFSFLNSGRGFTSFKFYGNDLGEKSQGEVKIDEAYLDIYTFTTDIRLGKQYIFWGRVDGTETPTNNINPQDFTRIKPEPEEQRIAVDALRINHFRDEGLILQGVWIPQFTPGKLPSLSLPPSIRLKEPELPSPEIKNSSWGLKVDRFTRWVDFSLSYLYTWDSFPDYEIDLSGYPFINLIPTHHRIQIYGADFATAVGELDIRGEFAYFQTRDRKGDSLWIKNPYLQYVLEAGYPVTEDFDIIAQIIGKQVFNFKSPEEYIGFEDLAEEFSIFYGEQKQWQSSLAAHLIYRMWYDRLKLEFLGIYNLTLHDSLIFPNLSYELGKGFNLELGAMVFEGKPDTQFGMMDREDFVYLGVKYSF